MGDVILSKAEIFAEAGEILGGSKSVPAGRTTIFKSVGIAIEDLAAENGFSREQKRTIPFALQATAKG